ncbi:hypothetical protein QAD02_016136 [Eretmocerus hayati]|uniref:Uncharacterized protein n=1 Tax=Eretmocerus hayati TaxID=131215 RepID=A0ACC2P9Q1_9HYME|nr:hypothetical protein QAD02_016136 [Eretmocerus hayati]
MVTRFAKKKSLERIAGIATTATIGLTIGSFSIEFLPHTLYIEKWRKIFALYSLGEEAQLPNDILQLYNNVMDDLKIKEKNRERYKPFAVTGFNVYNAGFADAKFGAIIGIPRNFTYRDKSSIDLSDIRVGRSAESLNPFHSEADNLLDSLVLSDKAKKFGIAREVLMSQQKLPLYRALESATMVVVTAFISEAARVQWGLDHRPKGLKYFVYLGSCLLGLSTWAQIRDGIYTHSEKKVDQKLAELGSDYVEGGIEFYDKQIKKNIALRSLMGPEGAKTFNRDGDEIFFFRKKRTPVTHRKKFFQEYTVITKEKESVAQ